MIYLELLNLKKMRLNIYKNYLRIYAKHMMKIRFENKNKKNFNVQIRLTIIIIIDFHRFECLARFQFKKKGFY